MKRYRVGLYTGDLSWWGGGRDLLRALAAGFSTADCDLFLIVPRLTQKQRASLIKKAILRTLRRLRYPQEAKSRGASAKENLSIARYVRESGCQFDLVRCKRAPESLARAVRKHQLDVVLPVGPLGRDFPAASVGYIPDLQHKHLPAFFSKKEIDGRDRDYRLLVDSAKVIVVTSRDAKHDLERYYPCDTCEVFPLPFSPLLESEWMDTSSDEAQRTYSLTTPYFLISNQFWIHKDHATAFRALAMLPDKNVRIVCTGNTIDYRMPEHFPGLQALLRELGIAERVKFLGLVPKKAQIAIMRGAIAVIQPTLFEGSPGGGAVENAIAVGTPAIVSDIAVNREIDADRVSFFTPGSAEELAQQMMIALQARYEPLGRQVLAERSAARQRRMGAALRQLVDRALASHQSPNA